MPSGYYRYPTIHNDTIVFVSEDDLWSVSAAGGVARRLTSNLGEVSRPILSPDGTQLAFIGREEGQAEVYAMPSNGGPARRMTYMGGTICQTAGWTRDGKIIFASNAGHWYLRFTHLYSVGPEGGTPQQMNFGLARAIAFGPSGGILLGRNTDDPARWKRYRGGTMGQLWIDEDESEEFHQLLPKLGNLSSPMWIGAPGTKGRIFFISDHEGIGNLYSCLPSGEDIRRHTHQEEYYVRNAASDGKRIVYHAGADLHLLDLETNVSALVPIEYYSPRVQRNRKFVDTARYLGQWSLHPSGQALAITARGKLFTFANWEAAVIQHGDNEQAAAEDEIPNGIRYRLPTWLSDGKRFIAVTDEGGEERFIIFSIDESSLPNYLPSLDAGRPMAIAANPKKDQIIFSNNRYELLFLDLQSHELRQIDRGKANHISGFDWSPDGEWVAYCVPTSIEVTQLKIWHAASGEISLLAQPVLRDRTPAFDPEGKYLFFISNRTLNPVYDNLQFELSFPRGEKPYLITLQKDLTSPFIPKPQLGIEDKQTEGDKGSGKTEPDEGKQSPTQPGAKEEDSTKEKQEQKPLQIDLEGIQNRIVPFPVPEGLYGRVLGARDGKVFYSRFPIEGALRQPLFEEEPKASGNLLTYNFEEQKEETFISGITDFQISRDGKSLIYRVGNHLRVIKTGEKSNNDSHGFNRKSGWINLDRVKVEVNPGAEWRQMYREAWRLQRDQFWSEDMSQVDWLAIHDRYLPLVDRVGSRSEFSDLMWEMQGELGTSHAYEFGGDYRPEPRYAQGFLGADFEFDPTTDGWRITHIYHGDSWELDGDSPLNQPGINIQVGDYLTAINDKKLNARITPAKVLVNQAEQEVSLMILPGTDNSDSQEEAKMARAVIVQTLDDESKVRYREWVESNRRHVHQASGDRIGYLHIPDMMAMGFAEFHRGYLAEVDHSGLIVDVRFNRGGHVSQLLLEKLARRLIGYDISRWGQIALPYPLYAVSGPIVALTNEHAGSDGDIFSHGFKLMKLGPLIGKRTWGGVVGITPTQWLVDGSLTTQPEFSSWFSDVGWGLENYGTDPDIEVDFRPQDYARGLDPQLERAIDEALKLLEANPPALPDFSKRPNRAAPKLPKE